MMKRETRKHFTPPKPRDIVKVLPEGGVIGNVRWVDEALGIADVWVDGVSHPVAFTDLVVYGSKGD